MPEKPAKKLKKVQGVPCLYINEATGEYVARKKVKGGGIKQEGLDTTNGALARQFLKKWVQEQETMIGEITLAQLIEKFKATKAGRKEATRLAYEWAIKHLQKSFPLYNSPIHKIRPSDLGAFFGQMTFGEPDTLNRLVKYVTQFFELAVADEYLTSNPVKKVPDRFKKAPKKKPIIPTLAQFNALVSDIRRGGHLGAVEGAADLTEFLGLAGLGEAEARNLDWSHIEWNREPRPRINVTRQKTGVAFYVPFYPFLAPFMVDLWERQGKPAKGKIFKIETVSWVLRNACKRLKFPHFYPRSLRRFCIVRLLRDGMREKQIADYQGHQDGGTLIMETYSEVISELDSDYEEQQLAKLSA